VPVTKSRLATVLTSDGKTLVPYRESASNCESELFACFVCVLGNSLTIDGIITEMVSLVLVSTCL